MHYHCNRTLIASFERVFRFSFTLKSKIWKLHKHSVSVCRFNHKIFMDWQTIKQLIIYFVEYAKLHKRLKILVYKRSVWAEDERQFWIQTNGSHQVERHGMVETISDFFFQVEIDCTLYIILGRHKCKWRVMKCLWRVIFGMWILKL